MITTIKNRLSACSKVVGYLAIDKISSKLQKKQFLRFIRQIKLLSYTRTHKQSLTDDVIRIYVIKMYVRKTNVGLTLHFICRLLAFNETRNMQCIMLVILV